MIPYDDIPEQLLITHPHHRHASTMPNGRHFTTEWCEEWKPFIRTELEAGRTVGQVANELNITAATLRKHMPEVNVSES